MAVDVAVSVESGIVEGVAVAMADLLNQFQMQQQQKHFFLKGLCRFGARPQDLLLLIEGGR